MSASAPDVPPTGRDRPTGLDGTPRLLLVHAHPDDETLTTGGTIARYVRAGADVTVVTCTLGEEGEVIGDRWAQLAADAADQLGGYRIAELTAALAALGVEAPVFLGGAGHWRDSGMAGTPSAEHPRAFVRADRAEAVALLAGIIRALRPHVVVTYDPNGGYGHPDHIATHEVTTAALDAAADPDAFAPGLAWDTPKAYWTVVPRSALAAGLDDLGSPPAQWSVPTVDDLPSVPDEDVTTVVDVSGVHDARVAALRAHATQVTVAPDERSFALSNLVAQPLLDTERFRLVRGEPGVAGEPESDLFAGLGTGPILD